MKTLIALASCFATCAAAAAGVPPFTCPSGGDWLMWSLTATEYAETPIFAGIKNTKIAAVCNCTESSPDADAGVWVVTLQPDTPKAGRVFGRPLRAPPARTKDNDPPKPTPPIQPGPGQDFYYLPGGSCTIVGPGSVMLRTADHRAAKWGAWKLQP